MRAAYPPGYDTARLPFPTARTHARSHRFLSDANRDALLAQIDALRDDEPQQALEQLRALDVSTLSTSRLQRLSFLLDHVLGE